MMTNASMIRIAVIVLAWFLLTAILIMVSPKQPPTPTAYFAAPQATPFLCSSGDNAITRTITSSGNSVVVYECDGGHYVRP